MDNKKVKKTRKPKKVSDKKKKTNKMNKNKNTQSIKINISSSGGLGGSGGTSVPTIPTPVQSFSRSERIGENVDVSNLLRRIENQQQTAFNNLSSIVNNNKNQNSVFEGEFIPEVENKDLKNYQDAPLLEQINRDNIIDEAEKRNNGEDGDELSDLFKEEEEQDTPLVFTKNPLAFKRNKSSPSSAAPAQSPPPPAPIFSGGGGGPSPNTMTSYVNSVIPPLDESTYIRKVGGGQYEFKFRLADGKRYPTLSEAQIARDQFIKDNNITFKEKKNR